MPTEGNLVHWRSTRQSLITKSTCEAELVAASETLEQAINLGVIIAEHNRVPNNCELSCDNSSSLQLIRHGFQSPFRTRHISVKGLWIHQRIQEGLKASFVASEKQGADALTKGLGASKLPSVMSQLRLTNS